MDPERRIAIALPLLPLREPPDSCSRAPGRPANIITPVRNKKTSDSAYRQNKNKRRLKKLLRGPRMGHLRDSRFYKKKENARDAPKMALYTPFVESRYQ